MTGKLCLACDGCHEILEINGESACADTEEDLKAMALEQGWKCEEVGCPEEGDPFYDRLTCPACQASPLGIRRRAVA